MPARYAGYQIKVGGALKIWLTKEEEPGPVPVLEEIVGKTLSRSVFPGNILEVFL